MLWSCWQLFLFMLLWNETGIYIVVWVVDHSGHFEVLWAKTLQYCWRIRRLCMYHCVYLTRLPQLASSSRSMVMKKKHTVAMGCRRPNAPSSQNIGEEGQSIVNHAYRSAMRDASGWTIVDSFTVVTNRTTWAICPSKTTWGEECVPETKAVDHVTQHRGTTTLSS